MEEEDICRMFLQSFALKLKQLEERIKTHDDNIQSIFQAIKQLTMQERKPKRKIGFVVN